MKIARYTCMHSRGRIIFVAIVLVLTLAALTFAVPALAQPADSTGISSQQAKIESLKAEIASINLASEQAVERYNQANTELENTRQQMAKNEKTLTETSVKLETSRDVLEQRLLGVYRGGSLSILDVILNSSSFSDFLSRFEMLGRISQQDRATIEEFLKYKAEVEQTQANLDAARQEQEKLVSTLADEKTAVESGLANRQQLLASAEAEVAQALAQQMQQGQINTPRGQEIVAESPAAPPAPEDDSPDDSSTGADPGYDPPPPPPASRGDVVSIAAQYLGVPYVWGGASPSGFDCSGLTMYVYAQVGVSLPHSAEAQYYAGTPVSPSEMAPGDLVFFGNPISHVGIYVGGGSMIHAPFEGTVVSYGGIGSNFRAARL